MNKVLVKLFIPTIEQEYEVWLPERKTMFNIINLLIPAINELSCGNYSPLKQPMLYDRATSKPFDINLTVSENNIKNGSQIILI